MTSKPRSNPGRSSPKTAAQPRRESRRARFERELREKTREISLSARVLVASEPTLHSQRDICDWFKLSDQTLRNWARRGMTTHGTQRQPLYVVAEVLAWQAYVEHLRREGQVKERVPQQESDAWVMSREATEDPGWYVMVPLSWDHPRREQLLAVAMKGRRWDPTHSDLEELYGPEEDRDEMESTTPPEELNR